MTLVNAETGEVIEELTRDAAERLSERIALRLDTIADNYVAVMPMIREAITRQAHAALGYRSPGDYVRDRFGNALSRLGVEVRREVVRELTEAGLSTRAIAPVVAVDPKTVRNDLRAGGDMSPPEPQTPEPAEEGEADAGSGHAPQGEGDSASGEDDPAQTEATSGDNRPEDYPEAPAPAPRPVDTPEPKPVVGIDGKTYKRPESKPKRSPLPDSYGRVLSDLYKKAESLTRLTEDDRYAPNRAVISERHAPEALRALTELTAVVTHLDPDAIGANEKARQWWLASLSEINEALTGFATSLGTENQ